MVPAGLALILRHVGVQKRMLVDLLVIEGVLQARARPDASITLAHQTHVRFLLQLSEIVVLHCVSKTAPELADTHLHVRDVAMLQDQPILVPAFYHLNGLLPTKRLLKLIYLKPKRTGRRNDLVKSDIKSQIDVRELARPIEILENIAPDVPGRFFTEILSNLDHTSVALIRPS